jgi:hypothetical protein
LQDLSNVIAARHNKTQFLAYLDIMSVPAMNGSNLQASALKGLKMGLNKNEALKETAAKLNMNSEAEIKASFELLRKLQ